MRHVLNGSLKAIATGPVAPQKKHLCGAEVLWKKRLAACYFPALLNAVSSPQGPLTAVFGMGTGVASPLVPPAKRYRQLQNAFRNFASAFRKKKKPHFHCSPFRDPEISGSGRGMAARPHGLSEMVSYNPRGSSASILSTRYSAGGLQGLAARDGSSSGGLGA